MKITSNFFFIQKSKLKTNENHIKYRQTAKERKKTNELIRKYMD